MIVGITLDAFKPRLFLILFGILCLFAVWFHQKFGAVSCLSLGELLGFESEKKSELKARVRKGLI